uniref:Putative secreted protein n=1 Tax=Ixodes ricinus TaxID=34613 RepID=A0A6B0U2C0_IXORI
MRTRGGTTRPRWALSLQLVGPVWAHTCVPGCISENFTCPRLHPAASGILAIKAQVLGANLQFFSILRPLA